MDNEIPVLTHKGPQKGSERPTAASLQHPLQEKAEMDIVLAIKHLLALEDHMREFQPKDDEEETWRSGALRGVELLRSGLFDMFEEKDKRFHCMAKHIMGASMALDEVDKLYGERKEWPQSEDVNLYADEARIVMIDILERLLGHEIENCKRCK